MSTTLMKNWNCPIPVAAEADRISLAHGEGARLTRRLIMDVILPRLQPAAGRHLSDAAQVTTSRNRLAICTDSHTVTPIFFPGGDLGSLAIYGTVNDLAVSGAQPCWLTLSLILEEGLPVSILEQVLDSAARAARECGVTIVAGDTKVVPHGAVDGLFVNTAGVGEMLDPVPPGPAAIQPGDRILVSGSIGRHGLAVMCARDAFALEPPPISDSGSLVPHVAALRTAGGEHIRAIRDATRGGVSAVLHEWAQDCGLTFALTECDLPVTPAVRGACELLGLDPLYVANEGTLVAVVAAEAADAALFALRQIPGSEKAAAIGEVQQMGVCPVTIRRIFGGPRPLDEPSGAPLPRIC